MKARGKRRIKSGVIVSNKMDKTLVVRVMRTYRHPLYGKVVKAAKKYYAHDEDAKSKSIGDEVSIMECRPYSKLKCWRVIAES